MAPAELRNLRRLAGFMVPASAEYDVPGADDDAIFADIIRTLGRDRNDVRNALTMLYETAGGLRLPASGESGGGGKDAAQS
jgi:hypothetical protein